MKRRSFVKASLITGVAGSVLPNLGMAEAAKRSKSQLYELRVYTLKDGTQQKLVEDYFQNAAIPAYNRFGSSNVGVFTELKPDGQTRIFVLIPFDSADDFSKVQSKLADDAAYQQQGAAYLTAPLTDPAYDRIESWLLQSFKDMPKLEAPEQKQRLLSCAVTKALPKVQEKRR